MKRGTVRFNHVPKPGKWADGRLPRRLTFKLVTLTEPVGEGGVPRRDVLKLLATRNARYLVRKNGKVRKLVIPVKLHRGSTDVTNSLACNVGDKGTLVLTQARFNGTIQVKKLGCSLAPGGALKGKVTVTAPKKTA